MSPTTVTAILLAVISICIGSSKSSLTDTDVRSRCEERDLICEVKEMEHEVARLEAILEEKTERLQSRSDLFDDLERRDKELSAVVLKLQSHFEELKGVVPEDEAIKVLEDEVRSLWSTSRKNHFDLHNLESKAMEADERVEDIKSKVEKMADVVTEHWIQIRHLEQALLEVQIKTADAETQLCLQKCSFIERMPLLLDQYLSRNMPALKLCWSKLLHQVNMLFSAVKKNHLQLQNFVREEMKKNKLMAIYTNEELVFFVASGLLTLPMLCTLMMLLSLFH